MRILLLGANGQLGRVLREPLGALGEVQCATRSGVLDAATPCLAADLADADSLQRALDAATPQLIVNAAAYTAVDRAEDEPDLADRVNHRALAQIGAWAAREQVPVVHYSTDYVFDGHSQVPYREDAATAPLGVYGRSKLAGEDALRDSGADHFILRTAWVYAAHGSNFLHTMLRLARERDELRVVGDQIGAPTPAPWIAASTVGILQRVLAQPGHKRAAVFGTYHLTAASHCSWYDFASAILNQAHAAGLIGRVPPITPIGTADYPTRARRPAFSVLDTSKLARTFGLNLPAWPQGLTEVIAELAGDERS